MSEKTCQPVDFTRGRLRVSSNKRHVVHRDGTPFFYLADTAWELFHRLDRDEVELYLSDRAARHFTAIQAVLIPEIKGLETPSKYGELPLIDKDPARPNPAWFDHVDYTVGKAENLGLFMALLPTWGSYTISNREDFFGTSGIFTPESAYAYGTWLGERYGQYPNIIWVLGGDRMAYDTKDIWREMARGLRESYRAGGYLPPVMTYHPLGPYSSSECLHREGWLDFNMVQTGHFKFSTPHEFIAHDYALIPTKPVLNGEPAYEGIPNYLRSGEVKMNDFDVRKCAWWSVMTGAWGHTYGANEIWMMYRPDDPDMNLGEGKSLFDAVNPWNEAIHYPGAAQVQHLRALIESRPMLTRVPDQRLLLSSARGRDMHIRACRCSKGSYAMVYIPAGTPVELDMTRISAKRVQLWWYNPRTGEGEDAGQSKKKANMEFVPPTEGHANDWVLVIDDAEMRYGEPGLFQHHEKDAG